MTLSADDMTLYVGYEDCSVEAKWSGQLMHEFRANNHVDNKND